ncbi:hypothetical protein [Mycobacterium sp.]|uniref:hypothetical protein n=1 Tax=Mycobacterium sp. TaxID=1785 RepID=UPI003F993DC8
MTKQEPTDSIVYRCDDGGWATIEDAKIVPLGDRFAHQRIAYHHDGDDQRPAAWIGYEIRAGVPVCTGIAMWSNDQTQVRTRDLSTSWLERVRDKAYAATGIFTANPAGGWVRALGPGTLPADERRVKRAATPPRKMTPEFLAEVAKIHNNTPPGSRIEAVRAAFTPTKEPRTILRWIAAAKEKGLIDE